MTSSFEEQNLNNFLNFYLSKSGHLINLTLLHSTLQQFLSANIEMGNPLTTNVSMYLYIDTFHKGRITTIAQSENFVGSIFGEILMG